MKPIKQIKRAWMLIHNGNPRYPRSRKRYAIYLAKAIAMQKQKDHAHMKLEVIPVIITPITRRKI